MDSQKRVSSPLLVIWVLLIFSACRTATTPPAATGMPPTQVPPLPLATVPSPTPTISATPTPSPTVNLENSVITNPQTYTDPELNFSLNYAPSWRLETQTGTSLNDGSGRTILLEKEGYQFRLQVQRRPETVGECSGSLTEADLSRYWKYPLGQLEVWRAKAEAGWVNSFTHDQVSFIDIIIPIELRDEADAKGVRGVYSCLLQADDYVFNISYQLPLSEADLKAGRFSPERLAELDYILTSLTWQVAQPPFLSTNLALAEANGVTLVGNIVYLTDKAGLHLLEIANPAAPQDIGFYPAQGAPGVEVFGGMAYLMSDGRLHLVDITEPTSPRRVGAYSLPAGANGLAVAEQLVFLSAGQDGFIILAVSNPATPRELSRTVGDASQVAVYGTTAYVVDGLNTLRLLDVSDPRRPHLLGAFRTDDVLTDLALAPSPADSAITLAYLGTLGQGVRIVDVSDPAGPREIGAYLTPGSVYGLALAGDRLYIANGWGASGLSVVDVSNPALPVEVSFVPAAREWDSLMDVVAAPMPDGVKVFIANRFEGLLVYPDNDPPDNISLSGPSSLTEWPTYRHDSLGVEVRYPTGWQVDRSQAFVWFNGPAGESFNIVNAGFPMTEPVDFLNQLGPSILMTKTLILDGQPALYVQLQPGPEAQGYQSVVAVITPDGRGLTIGNRSDPFIFEQILPTIRFFKPTNPP